METDTNPGADRCPRCGGSFDCGAAGHAPCACTTVTLSVALQDELRNRYQGCLCMACLRELAAQDQPPGESPSAR